MREREREIVISAVKGDLFMASGFSEEDALQRAGAGNISVHSAVVFGQKPNIENPTNTRCP